MQIVMKSNCWDGPRRKTLNEIKVESISKVIKPRSWIADTVHSSTFKMIVGYSIPIMLLASGIPSFGLSRVFASPQPDAVEVLAISDSVKGTILHAFDPLIDLIQALAYPIAGVMIAGGCLFIMVGNRDKGMSMLQNAAIGYILVQLAPMMLKLLVGIGSSM